ncbi:putative transporter [Venturia nashicola]|uniref:Putative transporter n=1 Tax=Venturia nashicola TaxID=86259 RepID=A0A4Z1P706_9PEZI|nr:putative transporter [Venturia nashicola]TLD36597.1 putative transporter [Venturia nashicola]
MTNGSPRPLLLSHMYTVLRSAARPVYRVRPQTPLPRPPPSSRGFRATAIQQNTPKKDDAQSSPNPSTPSSSNGRPENSSEEVQKDENTKEKTSQDKDGAVSEPPSSNSNGTGSNINEAVALPPQPRGRRSRLMSLRAQRARREAPEPARPELELPEWFAQKCVKPWDPNAPTNPIPKDARKYWPLYAESSLEWYKERTLFNAKGNLGRIEESPEEAACLTLDHYLEISAIAAASFATVSGTGRNTFWGLKANLSFYSAFDGGNAWLNSIINQVAKDHKAKIVRLDAQDIVEIGGAFLSPNAKDFLSLRTLGFDAYRPPARDEDEMEEEEDEEDDDDDDDQFSHFNVTSPNFSTLSKDDKKKVMQSFKQLDEKLAGDSATKSPNTPAKKQTREDDLETPTYTPVEEKRITAFWDTVIDGARAQAKAGDDLQPSEQKLMVCIEDFMEISNTPVGEEILNNLVENIERRRGENGEKIMIVGTSSSSEFAGDEDAQKDLDAESEGSFYRTVLITNDSVAKPPPSPCSSWEEYWNNERKQRVAAINLRNIQWVLKQIQPESHHQYMPTGLEPSHFMEEPGSTEGYEQHTLFDQVLTQEDAQRIVLTVIGFRESGLWNAYLQGVEGEPSLSALIKVAIRALQTADKKRFDKDSVTKPVVTLKGFASSPTPWPQPWPQPWDKEEPKTTRLELLRASCNDREKRLLGGVVLPESIRTTFKDIHVAAETVDAVRTLTSLSLSRPDAFSYGVLASDNISGLLLYGPPGTGKTLLAKAVAKESGSTVLTITGADLNNKWVGESEKTVKAMFTLARKLAPCVVFIDEADAILAARKGAAYRVDTLSQMLLEWDGMRDPGVFLMVATNRPFALDEAVLRRLPRRVLVDLPVKEDREAILKIHLRNEQVDDSVSLSWLAEQTPFYSGSDLKNVVVSAALACIKEEMEAKQAAEKNGDAEFKYAEKRTLSERHFKVALGEVSASISDDMSSLKEVKRFDEQFGAGKGKKKKSFGFLEQERKEGHARVRG